MLSVNNMSVTDIIKKAIDYPKNSLKNTVIFAGFLILFSLLSNLSGYFLFSDVNENMMEMSKTFTELISNIYSTLSVADWLIVIIGSIASIIVYLLIEGYIYRVYNGEDTLPEFNNFKEMLVEGLKIIGVTIIYDIIPAIILFLGFFTGSEYNSGIGWALIVIGLILLIIADLFLKPFAIANMVKKGEFKGALDISSITNRILQIGILPYIGAVIFVAIISAIVYFAISVLLTSSLFLLVIPYIWIFLMTMFVIISAVVASYLNLFSNKVYQLLYD